MLKRYRISRPPHCYWFFTCARPGRRKEPSTKSAIIPDKIVRRWVLGLPGPNTAIISLLGRKPDGMSEFSFYPFLGGFDTASERPGLPSFKEWLKSSTRTDVIEVREHPTVDFKPIPKETLDAVSRDIIELLSQGKTIVLIDSGGVTRSGTVCRHMHAVEDSSSAIPPNQAL